MKTIFSLTLPVIMLCAGLSVPEASAQVVSETVPVSLYVERAPISSVLRTLFQEAGIHNYRIDDVAGGRVTADFRDVPFVLAMRQVLSAAKPPLTVEAEDGVYHVRVRLTIPSELTGETRFYKIGIKHYDAGRTARLLAHRDGLIDVPPNYVVTANSASPAVHTVPPTNQPATAGGAPVTASGLDPRNPGSSVAAPVEETVLPKGVKRIFALQSDNSLVIEATPKGFHDLTDLQLASEGYDLVY